MKKLLAIILIFKFTHFNAQNWSEDFSSVNPPLLPANWLQNNVDSKTPDPGINSFSFGINAWVGNDNTPNDISHGKVAASTSWYSPAGTSNDWLISPSFSVPVNAALVWDARTLDLNFPDGYNVNISTTGTAVTSFSTTLFSVVSENDFWTNHALSLNSYSNQTIRIAFVNNSFDRFVLFLDNIGVIIPQSTDGGVQNINGLTRYDVTPSSQNIVGTFKNFGYSFVNSAVLNYNVNNGAVTTETINFSSPINFYSTANYSFTNSANFGLGTNKIKTWVSEVNGVNETINTNDTAYATIYVASQTRQRVALIEEFTSSTCFPCSSLNLVFDTLLAKYNPNNDSSLSVIKYQMNLPAPGNDPSYNKHSKDRINYYRVNDAPTVLGNGHYKMQNFDTTEINGFISEPAFADITAKVTKRNSTITAKITVKPFLNIPASSPIKLFQVLTQKYYNYPLAITPQKDYYHVMRKIFPDAFGKPQVFNDGIAYSDSLIYNITETKSPAQQSYDFWKMINPVYEYVAFLQDTISHDVLQSFSVRVNDLTTSLEEHNNLGFKNQILINVYPNPAEDFVIVGINLNKLSGVNLRIINMEGKTVFSSNTAFLPEGKHELKINTSSFFSGFYSVILDTDDKHTIEKLNIVR